MSLPILPSSHGRQRSTTRRAEGGGGSRVRASRVRRRTASAGNSRAGLGNLTRVPATPAGSGPKPTVRSSRSAIARKVEADARLKISVGEKACVMPCPALILVPGLHQRGVDAGLGQFGAKASLVIFRHDRPFHLVAFVQE